ncbi:MAG: hypothetical protein U0931_13695 [Vulcanimicrobiota bacterium]
MKTQKMKINNHNDNDKNDSREPDFDTWLNNMIQEMEAEASAASHPTPEPLCTYCKSIADRCEWLRHWDGPIVGKFHPDHRFALLLDVLKPVRVYATMLSESYHPGVLWELLQALDRWDRTLERGGWVEKSLWERASLTDTSAWSGQIREQYQLLVVGGGQHE